MRIQRHQTRRPTNIKIYYQHNRQKTTGNPHPRKDRKPENYQTTRLGTQDSYEKRHKQSTIPSALAKEKELKEEPIQKIQRRNKQKSRKKAETTPKNNKCGFCGQQNWSLSHKCPAKTIECNNCHKMGHFARVCRSKTNKRKQQRINYLEET